MSAFSLCEWRDPTTTSTWLEMTSTSNCEGLFHFKWSLMKQHAMWLLSDGASCVHGLIDWWMSISTVPLQKSTIVSPGLASSVTIAAKLFSCCIFLTARTSDIFPEKKRKQNTHKLLSHLAKNDKADDFFKHSIQMNG